MKKVTLVRVKYDQKRAAQRLYNEALAERRSFVRANARPERQKQLQRRCALLWQLLETYEREETAV